ncbi:hypothetical protein [Usitatibacter rugosus]|uniref:hypothetical protein n=1 Tax=Usitatibacter rugosus TaxID=2732067 RepID=UPI001487C700|nr:hypothetical protein [Usitatibacter rugosus]
MLTAQLYTFGRNADFVAELEKARVRFMIVGGLAVVFHGCRDPSNVDDLDILLDPSPGNAERFATLMLSVLPGANITASQLAKPKVQMPVKRDYLLDVLTPPPEFSFSELDSRAEVAILNGSTRVRVIGRADLAAMKRLAVASVGKDLAKHQNDLQCLEAV